MRKRRNPFQGLNLPRRASINMLGHEMRERPPHCHGLLCNRTIRVASVESQNCRARDEALPAHEAAPLWQAVLGEAAAHVRSDQSKRRLSSRFDRAPKIDGPNLVGVRGMGTEIGAGPSKG